MKFLTRSILGLSLISVSACSSGISPNSPQNQEQKSFQTKGLPWVDAQKSVSNIVDNLVGTYDGKNLYQDSIGRYTIMISAKTYRCKFNPSWYENIPKCGFTCLPAPKSTAKAQPSKAKYVYDL